MIRFDHWTAPEIRDDQAIVTIDGRRYLYGGFNLPFLTYECYPLTPLGAIQWAARRLRWWGHGRIAATLHFLEVIGVLDRHEAAQPFSWGTLLRTFSLRPATMQRRIYAERNRSFQGALQIGRWLR